MRLLVYAVLMGIGLLMQGCTITSLTYQQQELICLVHLRDVKHEQLSTYRGMKLERAFRREWGAANSCGGVRSEYDLDLNFELEDKAALIQGDTTVARSHLQLKINYKLYGQDQTMLVDEKLVLVDSYNRTESHYSNFIAEEEISATLLRHAAQDLKMVIMGRMLNRADKVKVHDATNTNS